MDVHLVLKKHPEVGNEQEAAFLRSKEENKIVFPRFQTQFAFKSISYPDENVFGKIAAPLIENKLMHGEDSLLLTLGPTNSGKSHLLFQETNSIVDQSLKLIFDRIDSLSTNFDQIKKYYPQIIDARASVEEVNTSFSSSTHFSISMFELYNDNIVDLLSPDSKSSRTNLGIVTDPVDFKLTPRNISKFLVNSYESARSLLFSGLKNRKTFPTYSNNESSRSHCFIFLNIHKVYANVLETTRFSIVDLAGLERSKSARTSGLLLKEAGHTNSSLTELGRCLELISMNQFHKTCLRTNKLTRLVLNDFVKHKHPVSILVTLDPFGEEGLILQTLRYIDPIKYQDLQRRSLLVFKSKAKQIKGDDHRGLTSEIDRLRKTQKNLKSKIQNLESSMLEKEVTIRKELYEKNEENLAAIILEQKQELNSLSQNFTTQTDEKLQDQANSYDNKLKALNVIIVEKQNTCDQYLKLLESTKSEYELIKKEYSELLINFEDVKSSKSKEVNALTNKLEAAVVDNDLLKLELETLNLKLKDMQANNEQIIKLKLESKEHIATLESDLKTVNAQINQLRKRLALVTDEAKQKDIELTDSKNENLKLLEKISDLEFAVNTKELKTKSLSKELISQKEMLESSLEMKQTELIDLDTTLKTLREESDFIIKSLKTELDKKDAELAELNSKNSLDTETFDKVLKSKEKELDNSLSEMTVMKDGYQEKIYSLEQEIAKNNQEISILKGNLVSESDLHKSNISKINEEKNILIEELNGFKQSSRALENKMQHQKDEIVSLSKKLEQANSDNVEITALSTELQDLRKFLEEEKERKNKLKLKLLEVENEKSNLAVELNEEIKQLRDSNEGLGLELQLKDEKLNEALSVKNRSEEELARLQMQCSDLKSELVEKERYAEKYSLLKEKYESKKESLHAMESEKTALAEELRKKSSQLLEYADKIKNLERKLELSGQHQLDRAEKSSTVEIDLALNDVLTGDQAIDKTPRKSLNILNTDPLDNIGLPDILSSPVKPPSFQIHSDSVIANDKIIDLEATQVKRKEKLKKISKRELLSQQKQNHEKKMLETYETPKSNKKKFKTLANTKSSDLNKKSLTLTSKLDAKLKKRKSSSPLKPGRKKVRKSVGVDDSP